MYKNFAALALCADVVFATLAVAAHLRRRGDLDATTTPLSAYLTERTRASLFVGYIALSIAAGACAVAALASAIPLSLTVPFAACFFIAALLPIPIALSSRRFIAGPEQRSPFTICVHRYSSWSCFISATVGCVIYSIGYLVEVQFRASDSLNDVMKALAALSVFAAGVCIFALAYRGHWYGFIQKLLVAALVVWIAAFAAAI